MLNDRHRCRVLAALLGDELGTAAVDLFVERVGAPPPTYVSPDAYERLVADAAGREASG